MSPIANIRRLRWLPRTLLAAVVLAVAQTSLLPCAMADDAVATTMSEHCAYCPSNATDLVGDCAYPHAPTINVFDRTAHHIAMLFDGPQLQPMAFNLDDLRQTQRHIAIVDFHPTPPRPIILTHCVQLK